MLETCRREMAEIPLHFRGQCFHHCGMLKSVFEDNVGHTTVPFMSECMNDIRAVALLYVYVWCDVRVNW